MYVVGLPYDGLPFAPQHKIISFPGDGLTFYSRGIDDGVELRHTGKPTGPENQSILNPDHSYRLGGKTHYRILIVPAYSYFCAYNGPDIQDFPLHTVTNIDWNRKTILRLIKELEGTFHKITTTQGYERCIIA